MRALIRNPGETITEHNGIVGIDWDTGAPLTNKSWAGGPYRLVEDYQESVEVPEEPEPIQSTSIEEKPAETVTIDGKTYTKDELLALLNQTS